MEKLSSWRKTIKSKNFEKAKNFIASFILIVSHSIASMVAWKSIRFRVIINEAINDDVQHEACFNFIEISVYFVVEPKLKVYKLKRAVTITLLSLGTFREFTGLVTGHDLSVGLENAGSGVEDAILAGDGLSSASRHNAIIIATESIVKSARDSAELCVGSRSCSEAWCACSSKSRLLEATEASYK